MGKINEILSKKTPLKRNGEPDFKKQEGNFKNAAGEAVELYKAQLQGQGSYNTKSIDEAKGGGPLETDQNKYFKSLYDRFGDDVTTQELIDKKFISKGAGDAYTAFTGGKNKGVLTPGAVTDVFKTKPITQTNQDSKTTDIPMETNYNMGYNTTVNANWAEGAQRRGTRRAERRANRDIRKYEEGSKGFLGFGKGKGRGELSANVLAAGDKLGKKIKGLEYDAEGNVIGEKQIFDKKGRAIEGFGDQTVTDQMRDRAKSLSQNKYNQALNTEKITKLPSSKTELGDKVTTNKMADDNAIDVSNYNMYNPGENDFSGAFTGFKSGLNTDDLKINVPDLGTMVSNALRNTTIGVSPSQNAENAKAKTNAEIDSEQEFIDNKGGMFFKMKRGKMNRPGYSN